MEPVLLKNDEQNAKKQIEALENFAPVLNKIIADYNSLKISVFKNDDFEELFIHPKEYFFRNFMADKQQEIAGAKINQQKLFDILDKPRNYESLIAEIISVIEIKLRNSKSSQLYFNDIADFLSCYEFDGKGQLNLKDEKKQSIKNSNKYYLKREYSILLFELAKLYTKIWSHKSIVGSFQPPFYNNDIIQMQKICKYNPETKVVEINYEELLRDDISEAVIH